MNTNERTLTSGFSRRLFLSTGAAMLIAAVISLVITLAEFNAGLTPYLVNKAEAVTTKIKLDIEYALDAGVPFSRLRGVDGYIDDLVQEHPEINGIRVVGADEADDAPDLSAMVDRNKEETVISGAIDSLAGVGAVIFGQGASVQIISSDIVSDGQVVAQVQVVIDGDYVNSKMASVFFDTLVILIAVSLVALEVIVVIYGSHLAAPFQMVETAVQQRASGLFGIYHTGNRTGRLERFVQTLNQSQVDLRDRVTLLMAKGGAITEPLQEFVRRHQISSKASGPGASVMDARIPLFVFCFAEELQKSFLPLFVAEYYSESDLFSRDIMQGLPISAFMFVIAVCTPFAGKLVDRFGNKPLFIAGLIPAIAGYLMCFAASSANEIVVARSLTAIGYAVITISCQTYIAAVVDAKNRARGMAIFVGVLMTATMCGTAIGAILADWLGYKPVFLIATGFALVAGVLGWSMLSKDLPKPETKLATADAKRSPIAVLSRNGQFILIVLFCAIPAKVILTGFLYLFVPIYLASLDATQSEIGRVMMLYSLIIIPVSPLASRFADQMGKNLWMVIIATVLSGIVLLGLYQNPNTAGVLLVVAALGVVHSFLKAPLIVAAMEAAEKSPDITRTGALSLLRTSERVGSVIGPVVVAALLVTLDFGQVAVLLGLTVAALGVIMGILTMSQNRNRHSGTLNA
jgi:predicted MFS family arabinose efflux permease